MKTIFITILDGLTYKDLAGFRQPRAYTVISALILILLFTVSGMAMLNQYLLLSTVKAAPVSISLSTQAPEATAPAQPGSGTPLECPGDSSDWSLSPTYASRTYNVIQPACVYQGLEKTIAWALAVREGYSRARATELLGFADMPMRQLRQVTIPANTKGLGEVPVSFIPPDPDLTEWRLNANGEPAITYAMRGCFRTSSVVGNTIETWGGEYSVICLVVEDAENTHIIYSLDGHIYTSPATPTRSFLLFGYLADGLWVWIGTQEQPRLGIKDPEANAHERETIAAMYDTRPWDTKWLGSTYHLLMQKPPQNWRDQTDENDKQFILNELSVEDNP